MSTRPIVSYDDISLPYQSAPSGSPPPVPGPSKPPPSKKRKRNNQKSKQNSQSQHRNDPGSNYYEDDTADLSISVAVEEEDGNESRELNYDEIWDDSALIDAWNAATEEYEAWNGPEKDWKKEPVHKSPLWYNVPPSPSKLKSKLPDPSDGPTLTDKLSVHSPEGDSKPLDFDTFIPTHDPSLDIPIPTHPGSVPGPDYSSHYLPEPPGPMVGQDEAFTRALGAMYWGGYWTAIYHCQRRLASKRPSDDEVHVDDSADVREEEEEIEVVEEEEDFVSTQR